MSGIHHFLLDSRIGASPVHRLDPRAKILGLVGFTIIAVSTPARSALAFVLYAAVMAFLVGLSRLPVAYVLKRLLVVIPFVLMVAVFLPFFGRSGGGSYSLGGIELSRDGLLVLWNVLAKASLGVLSMVVLVSTTSFPELIAGLERLRMPRVFTLITAFMYRYSFLFVEEFQRMRRAMEARNYKRRWLWDAAILGHLLSSLFLRSYHRGERVYVAMVSRGYTGTMPVTAPLSFAAGDAVFLGLLAGLLALIRLSTGLLT